MQAIDYRITTEYIELNQLLKVCGLADSGGAGGARVTEGNVQVDGQQELRKRCKIRPGQVVQLGDARITVLMADPAEVAAKAEARVAMARAKATKKKIQAATPKAAAPWAGPGGAKPGPKARAKPLARKPDSAPTSKGITTKKTGNVFAANAEGHRQRRKP